MNALQIRKFHRFVGPIMVLPLLLTLVTGVAFQIVDMNGQDKQYKWLIQAHKGNFGSLHLDFIYPFLNGLGLLVLVVTGVMMWRQMQSGSQRMKERT
jgi:uncharacterized iron-regulated membrane protein